MNGRERKQRKRWSERKRVREKEKEGNETKRQT